MNDETTSRQEASYQCRVVLFITGQSPRSQRARMHLKSTLEKILGRDKDYEIVDVLIEPTKMLDHGIFATPALMVKPCAGDPSYLVGDLSDEAKLRELLSYCI